VVDSTAVLLMPRWLFRVTDWQCLFGSLKECDEKAEAQNARWLEYVDTLSPADLNATFQYRTTDGDTRQAVRQHMLLHVFNHATHHRFVVVPTKPAYP
jgi:uncharacterized damage-inducible protein DinB